MMGLAALLPAQGPDFLPELQPAHARWGPFATANYWAGAVAGVGPDFQNDRVFWLSIWVDGTASNNQTYWAFNTATAGWILISGNANPNTLTIFFRGTGGGSFPFMDLYRGLNRICIRQKAGVLTFSANGSVPIVLALVATYTPASGAGNGVHAIGKNQGEASSPATTKSFIGCAVIDDAGFTDAQMQVATGLGAPLDRFGVPAVISGNAGLTWLCPADGWDGVSTTYAGTGGSAPYTLTRAGTGGGKTVLPEYLRYRVPLQAMIDFSRFNVTGVTGAAGTCSNAYAQARCQSSAIDVSGGPSGLVVDSYVAHWSVPGNIQLGAVIAGTQQLGNQNGLNPVPGTPQVAGYLMLRDVDAVGIPAGANKAISLISGVQTKATGTVCSASSPAFVRVPKTTPLTWIYKSAIAKTCVFVGDSRFGQMMNVSSASGTTGPVYVAWPALVRTNFVASRVACVGWGFGTWQERVGTSPFRDAFTAELLQLLIASGQNWLWIDMGYNDWFTNAWANLAAFKTAVQTWVVQMLAAATAAGIVGFKLYLVQTVSATGDTTPNTNGYTLPDLGTALSQIVTAIADSRLLYFDARALLGLVPANRPDGIHYDTPGHALYEAGGPKVAFGY